VGNIPQELRTNEALGKFFAKLCGPGSVAEVRMALELKELEKKVGMRAKKVLALEHVSNVFRATGKRPTHKTKLCCGGLVVDSMETYTAELLDLNSEVSADLKEVSVYVCVFVRV
jgi:hypothetical protein